ncbi:MAG: hypothetical protein K9L74_05235 [Candidatus Izimaplasma sp.]|nr:hypothetical protein [Candidatus Izimaplasma bacterium]
MITQVTNKTELKEFVYFIKDLYKNDPNYVFPIFFFQLRELKQEILDDKRYQAILMKQEGEVVGRLLFTYDYSKKQDKEICYFSFFDTINDLNVVQSLFQYVYNDMKDNNINYIEGTFSPHDPDTRRGILVEGFDLDPVIFTSYNYPYYSELLEKEGFKKAIDTVLLNALVNKESKKKLNTFSKFFRRNHSVQVDSLNWKQLDKDLEDVEEILADATNEIIYQDAPDINLIRETAKKMKPFIDQDLIKIAREKPSGKPVGFCLVLPDFNQVLKQTNGHFRPFKMFLAKRHITKARGTMQYITNNYQNTGLIGHMFNEIYDEFIEKGITEFEAGTMMENNPKPINAFKKFGGSIIKTFRLYGKDIT